MGKLESIDRKMFKSLFKFDKFLKEVEEAGNAAEDVADACDEEIANLKARKTKCVSVVNFANKILDEK